MGKIDTKISYDYEEDILNLSRSKSSKASVEVGDFIIDVGNDGFLSAIEILNASENLNLSKDVLKNVNGAKMSVLYKPNYVLVILVLKFKGIEKDVRIPLTINLGHKNVEREETIFVR